jgi:cell division protein FtsB
MMFAPPARDGHPRLEDAFERHIPQNAYELKLRTELTRLRAEVTQLRAENARLRSQIGEPDWSLD